MEIWSSKRKVLKASEVGHVSVPRLPELTVKNIVDEAFADPVVSQYLPSKKPKRAVNRDWLFTVSSSLLIDLADYCEGAAHLLPLSCERGNGAAEAVLREEEEGGGDETRHLQRHDLIGDVNWA